jgi:hypothetical protein
MPVHWGWQIHQGTSVFTGLHQFSLGTYNALHMSGSLLVDAAPPVPPRCRALGIQHCRLELLDLLAAVPHGLRDLLLYGVLVGSVVPPCRCSTWPHQCVGEGQTAGGYPPAGTAVAPSMCGQASQLGDAGTAGELCMPA